MFKEKVWKLTGKIPRGRVTTYGEIAKKLNTKAYRAVGQALKCNPYAPKVPCHRVVKSDGSIGGYDGVMNSKKKIAMLRREGVLIKNNKIVGFRRKMFSLSSSS